MTLQNVRSLLWRGEDLGFGGGNTNEQIVPTQAAGATRPIILTRAFTGSVDISSLITVTAPWVVTGRNRILVNRNPRYWLTVTGSNYTTNLSTSNAVSFPIAPLQAFFLPQNLGGTVMVLANNAWPYPVPLTGATTATVPLAQATNVLTFDLVIEQ